MARSRIIGREKLHARLLALPDAITSGVHDELGRSGASISGEQKALLGNDEKLRHATGWKFADRLKVIIYSGSKEAFWARWREFGTAPHSLAPHASRKTGRLQDKGPHHPGERAAPYFFTVYRVQRKQVTKNIAKSMKDAMKKVARQ